MGRTLVFARGGFLADVQGTLSSEGLWEGTAAIALVVVVDMVAEQPTCTLWGERRVRKMSGGKEIEIMEEGKDGEDEEKRRKYWKKQGVQNYYYFFLNIKMPHSQSYYCHIHC